MTWEQIKRAWRHAAEERTQRHQEYLQRHREYFGEPEPVKAPTQQTEGILGAIRTMPLKVPTLIAGAAILGAVIGYGWDKALSVAGSDDALKPVDISFSLGCRELEGQPEKILPIYLKDYEKEYAKAEKTGDWGYLRTSPLTAGLLYEKNARVAYVHGRVDSGSIGWLLGSFVTEVSNEIFVIKGFKSPIGFLREGIIDRRTGHGDYTVYNIDTINRADKDSWENSRRKVWKQYELECEPSKPAKF